MAEAVTKSDITPDIYESTSRVVKWETGEITLTASGGGTPSAETETIDVRGFGGLSLTVDHNRTGSDSTDLDVLVYTSVGGTKFDNVSYASVNLGAAKVKTVPIQGPICYLKIKADNQDSGNATKVLLKLVGQR